MKYHISSVEAFLFFEKVVASSTEEPPWHRIKINTAFHYPFTQPIPPSAGLSIPESEEWDWMSYQMVH